MFWEVTATAIVIGLALKYFGCFDSPEVSTASSPAAFAGGLTVYYKHHVGAYGGAYGVCRELMQLVPNAAGRGFGIYYDNPAEMPAHLLQSAVGVIIQTGTEFLVKPAVIEELNARGLKKMFIPEISRSVSASCSINFACAVLPAPLNPIAKTYAAMMDYAKSNSLSASVSMELYTLSSFRFTVHFPLDHQEAFIVPE
ncbi:hypothetical protein PENTCL1PPCAC_3914, partial [Pristionchus entomophagus]